jgi:predicted SPOUT superfamily RNA methylase MTH1
VSDQKKAPNGGHEYQSAHRISDSTLFLARVLQYLETPQYLRKAFFPVHKVQYNPINTLLDKTMRP